MCIEITLKPGVCFSFHGFGKAVLLAAVLLWSVAGQGRILGWVEGQSLCSHPAEVFISQGRTLLFQVHVPMGSSFEVKLNPGEYTLTAVNEQACLSEQKVEVDRGQGPTALRLRLEPTDQLAHYNANNRSPAMVSGTQGTFVGCHALNMPCSDPSNWRWQPMPWAGPWWNMYGNISYPQFSYPCAWGGWGCHSPSYPRGGPIALGKPNIYFVGPDRAGLHLSLVENSYHHLMATSPAHKEKGWHFDIQDQKIRMQGGVTVPYLFYDSRGSVAQVQSKVGFCGNKNQVVQQMIEGLTVMGFPRVALEDFREHWQVRFPPMETCVFPVETKAMHAIAPVKSNQDLEWTRILFVAVPRQGEGHPPQELVRFLKPPRRPWLPGRHPAAEGFSSKKLKAFEWGVAFPIH